MVSGLAAGSSGTRACRSNRVTPMKYLIVNGDDFGASAGINRGIVEAHCRGILTSTSLLVDSPWSGDAAERARDLPGLSIGLHIDLPERSTNRSLPDGVAAELERQFFRFKELVGRPPTHIDSHHNVHRAAELLFYFLEFAHEHDLPLREYSGVRYLSSFYGRWSGEQHLEQITVENLLCMLKTQIQVGVTELSCHPGYIDADFKTGYAIERETELRTLCDPRVRRFLIDHEMELISYRELARTRNWVSPGLLRPGSATAGPAPVSRNIDSSSFQRVAPLKPSTH